MDVVTVDALAEVSALDVTPDVTPDDRPTCRVMCDRSHPCSGGGACTPLVESDLEGRGYCP